MRQYRLKAGKAAEWRYPAEWEQGVTVKQMVDAFLNIHHLWWISEGNALCGRREECQSALIRFVNGLDVQDLTDRDFGLHYVVEKFDNEFLVIFERRDTDG